MRRRARPVELVGFVAVAAAVGALLPALVPRLVRPEDTVRALDALRATTSILFACAGVLRLVRWRMTGEAREGHLGSAWVAFGLISAPTTMLAPAIFRPGTAVLLSPVSRGVAVAVCLLLLLRARRAPYVDSRLRPLRVAVVATLTAWLGMAALARTFDARSIGKSPTLWALIELALTTGWLVFAVGASRRALVSRSSSSAWLAMGLLTLATVECWRAFLFVSPGHSPFVSTGLQLLVGALGVANAGADLSETVSFDGNRMLSLSGALAETEEMLDEEECHRQERLHDARSVIAALKAASITLDRHDERLDAATKHRLRSSLVSELERLQQVIDARNQEPPHVFRLDVALAPLFIAEQRNGLVVDSVLGDVSVLGRPLEFVTVMQNLLVNARRYAPTSPVTVRAVAGLTDVKIYVEDRGPGVAFADRDRVFDRGFRAAPGPDGSGLGLYLARRFMRDQDGEIAVEGRPGGGARFVLSLPRPPGDVTPEPMPVPGVLAEV